ncbi:MAG: hypothetical protein Q4G10_07130, partial [Bacteroidia bacterium]|nr:hypothetical protein [Bacteroidia bacterium]
MMDTTEILLKYLKKKQYIPGKLNEKRDIILSDKVELKSDSDLFIRDALVIKGTVLQENLEEHYYIVEMKNGSLNSASTYAIIARKEDFAEIVAYAHEGLIKQNLAGKTIEKLKAATGLDVREFDDA